LQRDSTVTRAGLILAMFEIPMLPKINGRAQLGLALALIAVPQGPFGGASATAIARNRGSASGSNEEPAANLVATAKEREGASFRQADSAVEAGGHQHSPGKNDAAPGRAQWAGSLLAWKAELAEDVFGRRSSESVSTPVAPSLLQWKDELGEDIFGHRKPGQASLGPALLEWKAELADDIFGSTGKEAKTKLTIFQQLSTQTKMAAGDIILIVLLVVVLLGVTYLLFTGNVAEAKKNNEPGSLQHSITQLWQDATSPSQRLIEARSPNPYAMGSWAQHEFSQQQATGTSTADPYPRTATGAVPGRIRSQKACC